MRRTLVTIAVVWMLCLFSGEGMCVHDHFAEGATYHYYNDLGEEHEGEGRLLQTTDTLATDTLAASTSTSTRGR